jgi:hypothetical protein
VYVAAEVYGVGVNPACRELYADLEKLKFPGLGSGEQIRADELRRLLDRGFWVRHVAEALGVSTEVVKSWLNRGKREVVLADPVLVRRFNWLLEIAWTRACLGYRPNATTQWWQNEVPELQGRPMKVFGRDPWVVLHSISQSHEPRALRAEPPGRKPDRRDYIPGVHDTSTWPRLFQGPS